MEDKKEFIFVLIFLLAAVVVIDAGRESLTGKLVVSSVNKEDVVQERDAKQLTTTSQGARIVKKPTEMDGARDITILSFTFRIINGELVVSESEERSDLRGFLPPGGGEWYYDILSDDESVLYNGYIPDPTRIFVDKLKDDSLIGGLKVLDKGEFAIVVPTEVLQKANSINIRLPKEDGTFFTSTLAIPSIPAVTNTITIFQVLDKNTPAPLYRCNTLVNNGNPKEKLDIVLVGDDWNSTTEFGNVVRNIKSSLLKIDPYRSQKQDINVHAVIPSLKNISLPNSQIKLFEMHKPASVCPYDKILLIDNIAVGPGSTAYANIPLWAYIFIVLPLHPTTGDLVAHEFGHLFYLGDEYSNTPDPGQVGVPSMWPNCEYISTCPLTTSLGSSCYNGCAYTSAGDRFRDDENDIMRQFNILSPTSNYSGAYGPLDRGVIEAGIDYFANKLDNITVLFPRIHAGAIQVFKLSGAFNFGWSIIDIPLLNFTGTDAIKDNNGSVHVSLYDLETNSLYYIIQTTNSSSVYTLLDANITGLNENWKSSIALDQNGFPSIAYSKGNKVRYARYDGNAWNTEIVLDYFNNSWVSLDYDSHNIPYIVVGDDNDICIINKQGPSWGYCDFMGTGGGTGGHYAELAIDSQNKAHITYVNNSGILRYTKLGSGSGWTSIDIGGTSSYISLALDSQNKPHISYIFSSPYSLKHAYFNGSWVLTEVESSNGWPVGAQFGYSDIGIDDSDNVIMAYPLYDGINFTNAIFYDVTHKYKRVLLYEQQIIQAKFKTQVLI